MEGLSRMLHAQWIGGSYQVSRSGQGIIMSSSHLLFVDNTLIFCGANPNHLCHHALSLLMF
jgi:hypothetical protein